MDMVPNYDLGNHNGNHNEGQDSDLPNKLTILNLHKILRQWGQQRLRQTLQSVNLRQPCYCKTSQTTPVKFVKADPCPDHMLDPRWISENGIWEIGVYPVMFGKRVRVGKVKNDWCSLDYCAGADTEFLKELIVAIMVIMESFDETVKECEVEQIFPSFEIKPINRDPLCWAKIKRLAIEANLTQTISKPNLTWA